MSDFQGDRNICVINILDYKILWEGLFSYEECVKFSAQWIAV